MTPLTHCSCALIEFALFVYLFDCVDLHASGVITLTCL